MARILGTTALTVATLAASTAAYAAEDETRLDEVVVTAQRRVENLQDVPISVVAIGGNQLRATGVQTIEAINRIAPNVVVERVGLFPGAASLSMRGVGYSGIESFTDPDVAVYVNGIYQARNATALSQTVDVGAIEVLRGPQGTLYGRNAFAGAISVQTNRPDMDEFGGSAVAAVGNFGLRDFDFIANVPIAKDLLAGRIALRSHRLDGLWTNNGIIRGAVDNTIKGDRVGAEDALVIRPSLRFTPNDKIDIQLIGEFLREKDQAAPIGSTPIVPNANLASGFTPSAIVGFGGFQYNPFGDKSIGIKPDGSKAYTTGYGLGDRPMKFNQQSYTLDASYDAGFGKFRFLGNHQDTHSIVYVDTDGSVANIFSSGRWEHHKSDSAEVQFVSSWEGPFDLTAGLFFFHDRYRTTQLTFTNFNAIFPDHFDQQNYLRPAPGSTLPCAPVLGGPVIKTGCLFPAYTISYVNNGGERKAEAAYVQGEYHITDALSVVAGVRYSWERKYNYYGSNSELGSTGLPINVDPDQHLKTTVAAQLFTAAPFTNDGWAPRLGVNYKVNDDILLFAFYQKAFKSGGFNANSADRFAFQTPYGPEKVDSFEGGMKGEFLDGRVRANINAFYSKFKDLQRSQVVLSPTAPSGVTTVTTNNADLKSYGVETEFAAKVMQDLTLFANVGWNKAYYTRYCFDFNGAEASRTPVDTLHAICGAVTTVTLANGTQQFLVPQDFSANKPLRAPRWDITAGFTKDFPLNFGDLSITASLNHRSSAYVDLANRPFSYRPSMTVYDASARFVPTGGRYAISVWGRNLTNEVEVLGYTPVGPFAFSSPTPPRVYGITASVNF